MAQLGGISCDSKFIVPDNRHIPYNNSWNWYKGIVNKGIGQKSRVTLWLSATFTLVVLTGIILFNVDGANSSIGLCHYNIGILMNVLSIGHIFKRIPILRKCLKKNKFKLNSVRLNSSLYPYLPHLLSGWCTHQQISMKN